MHQSSRRPVIVGVGEIRDRPELIEHGLDPIGLMAEATRRAVADTGVPVLPVIDSVDVVHQITWRYDDTARVFCTRLGIEPARAVYRPGGGESPIRLIHEAALRISSGESDVALVCGGEARSTVQKAHRANVELPWPPLAQAMEHSWDMEGMLHRLAFAHGVAQPTFVYPFYENACPPHWGQSPAEAHAESATLWARYADVAQGNPFSWARAAVSAEEIATVSEANRPIAYPYSRLMVANPTVNQGAAVLMMSEGRALELGIAPDRLIYIVGGAAANEPSDYLSRDTYHASPAQDAVLRDAVRMNNDRPFDALELYSCFPCVPKMARRTLGLGDDVQPTVTGGLTFFGGPFSSYMTHAACAMARTLREKRGTGLLYAQGDFVTKHHALLVSADPPEDALSHDYDVTTEAAARRGVVPSVVEDAVGDAVVETFTVIYDATGNPAQGVVILRLPTGDRTMARVPASDKVTIALLIDPGRSPVGAPGTVGRADDGLLEWTLTRHASF